MSSGHAEEVKGQLWHIKGEMLVHGVSEDLCSAALAAGVLGVFERVQDGVDHSGSLLLWRRVRPAVARQRGQVEEEVDGRHVDFHKLLL